MTPSESALSVALINRSEAHKSALRHALGRNARAVAARLGMTERCYTKYREEEYADHLPRSYRLEQELSAMVEAGIPPERAVLPVQEALRQIGWTAVPAFRRREHREATYETAGAETMRSTAEALAKAGDVLRQGRPTPRDLPAVRGAVAAARDALALLEAAIDRAINRAESKREAAKAAN